VTDQQVVTAVPVAGAGPPALADLLPRLGHQLREPVGCIIGLARVMQSKIARGITDPADQANQLAMLENSAAALLATVERIVEVANVARGTEPPGQVVDCREIVAAVAAQFDPEAAARGHRVLAEVPGAPVPTAGAPAPLRRLLAELTDNAVKYGGEADVHLRLHPGLGGGASIEVADGGRGIAPGERERIFAPYARGEAAAGRDIPGAGLGLYLVAVLAARLGARLRLVTGEGRGSTFIVDLTGGGGSPADQ
jgi:signal transduction histidine kinase